MKHLTLFLVATLIVASFANAQQIKLINSGEVLNRAAGLRDSQEYDLAIKHLLTIPKRDTNYVTMQDRLAHLYLLTKEYDKSEVVANDILKKRTEFKGAALAVKARSYERRKDYAKAIEIAQGGLKDYPFHVDLLYQLATAYHNSNDYKNAIKTYYRIAVLYPYSTDAHLNLANIAVLMGEKTHAMLSYGMYLTLASTENTALVTLENVASNQLDGEGNLASQRVTGNAYERLDQILISKLALDKKFNSEIPIDAATVKQFEMLFQQLNTASTTSDDPWLNYYGPIYSAIRDQNLVEPFIYHILESTPIEAVKKWNSKNKKKMDAYFEAVNKILVQGRTTVSVPESFGFGPTINGKYTENYLQGIGKIANGVEEGKWIYLYRNGERSAEGTYKAGKKIGVWNYFTNKGETSSVENEDNGEITIWRDGRKALHYFLKDEKVEGNLEFYNNCGAISETQPRQAGKRNGKCNVLYESGIVKSEFEYVDDKLEKTWIDYDLLGRVTAKYPYKNDQREGVTEQFWPNGKIKARENYSAGQASGISEGYYDNGQVQYKGQYLNSNATGEWLYYNRAGKQGERRVYRDGALDKENIFLTEGRPYAKFIYDNGKLVQIIYIDAAGKETAKFGSPKGDFKAKLYYPGGALQGEGEYKNGKRVGKWKLYHFDGTLDAEYNYVDGEFDGEQIDYYRNGKKLIISQYKNGVLDGHRLEFYYNGQLGYEVWYVDGKKQQQALSYFIDGGKKEDLYYLNDKQTDSAYSYSEDGRLVDRTFSTNGDLTSETLFNPLLPDYTTAVGMQGNKSVNYHNGSPFLKYSMACGLLTSFDRFYPDGKLFSSTKYVGEKIHGSSEQRDEFGNLQKKGSSVFGDQHGLWTYYSETGKPDQLIRYVYGKIDSVLTAYYDFGGVYFTAEYSESVRNGLTRVLAPDGTPVVEKKYLDGELVEVRATGKNGQFGEWMPFSSNLGVTAYYATGKKSYEEQFKNGALSEARRIYFPDGKLAAEYRYVDGEDEGPFVVNYPSGKPCLKGQYHLGEIDGLLEVFQENGMPLKTVTYKLGSKKGVTTIFKNGVKSRQILYFGYPIK